MQTNLENNTGKFCNALGSPSTEIKCFSHTLCVHNKVNDLRYKYSKLSLTD